MSRQVRRVPKNWQHPKYWSEHREKLEYKPLRQGYRGQIKEWKQELKEWREGWKLWQLGKVYTYLSFAEGSSFEKGIITTEQLMLNTISFYQNEAEKYNYAVDEDEEQMKIKLGVYTYEDYAGEPPHFPNPSDYMPTGPWYQVFETVSEGTPVTPAFSTKKEIVKYLITQGDFWHPEELWTQQQAERMVRDEYAPSAAVSNGKFYSSRESLDLA